MARIQLTPLLLVAMTACESSAPDGLPASSMDAGVAVGPDLDSNPDLGTPDVGVPPPMDMGLAPLDMGMDLGPPVRTVQTRPLLSEREITNHVLLPDFETQVVNGGWLALSLDVGQPLEWRRRTRFDAPSDRREMALLPVDPGGIGLYGFGVVPPGDLEGSVWLGMEDPREADWEALVTGLIVYAPSLGSALVIFQPSGESRREEEIEWRRYEASAGAEIVGRFTFGVQSAASRTVWVNGPHVRTLAAQPGARRASNLSPIPPGSTWSTAVEGLQSRVRASSRRDSRTQPF